jgi:periplasmic copper chaperone A
MKKLALIMASVFLLAGCATPGSVEITNTWVKSGEMSVQGGMSAVYGTITNNTDQDVTLIGGTTSVAVLVEVHEMAMIDGQMQMQAIRGGLVIPAGQSAVLEPGGNHLMLMMLQDEIIAGQTISVTFDLEGAEDITLSDIIAKPSAGGDETYHQDEKNTDN